MRLPVGVFLWVLTRLGGRGFGRRRGRFRRYLNVRRHRLFLGGGLFRRRGLFRGDRPGGALGRRPLLGRGARGEQALERLARAFGGRRLGPRPPAVALAGLARRLLLLLDALGGVLGVGDHVLGLLL